MSERLMVVAILMAAVYCLYCCQMWFTRKASVETDTRSESADIYIQQAPDTVQNGSQAVLTNKTEIVHKEKYNLAVQLAVLNACSVLEIFTKKPEVKKHSDKRLKEMENSDNSIAVVGILIFLAVVTIHGILDVLNFKEEEKQRIKANPSGERRQSLSEFANKKPYSRDSGKLCLNLFKIAETTGSEEEPKPRRMIRPYVRGESTNSYLTEKQIENESLSTKSSETPTGDLRTLKRCSVSKVFGARPPPMIRRSSSPALPLNPDIQALMLRDRRPSTDSDDEDGKGRRVRIIRRF